MANPGIPFNATYLSSLQVSAAEVAAKVAQAKAAAAGQAVTKQGILQAIAMLDLTTLQGDDTPARVTTLLKKAQSPLAGNAIKVAAVCLYQPFVAQALAVLNKTNLGVATVAGGFPAGQMLLDVKCADIEQSVQLGATEIDAVINRTNPLTGDWEALYAEVRAFKVACGSAKLKVIIATGELADDTVIAKTSWVCMMAGADFIKTSTGLEKVNATLEAGVVMMDAIGAYEKQTGIAVGFKPAGGIRTTAQAMEWLALLRNTLGEAWMNSSRFRIGASGLLDDLVTTYEKL